MPLFVMHGQNSFHYKAFLSFRVGLPKQLDSRTCYVVSSLVPGQGYLKLCVGRAITPVIKIRHTFCPKIIRAADEYREVLSDEDDDLCPVECVREFKTDEEFCRIMEKAKETRSLVVVDFFRTSCGSCKYIEQGFAKLCKKSGDHEAPVIFLKHNVSMLFI